MIRYVPSSAAPALSDALWALTRPSQVRETGDTMRMFGWVDDLQTPSQRWLVVDTTFTIPVHPEAVLDGIADILQPWIDGGHLPADTNTILSDYIESMRGQTMVVYDAFPQIFKDMSLDTAQMIAAGRLANPSTTP